MCLICWLICERDRVFTLRYMTTNTNVLEEEVHMLRAMME